jgi:hypothetical protein
VPWNLGPKLTCAGLIYLDFTNLHKDIIIHIGAQLKLRNIQPKMFGKWNRGLSEKGTFLPTTKRKPGFVHYGSVSI